MRLTRAKLIDDLQREDISSVGYRGDIIPTLDVYHYDFDLYNVANHTLGIPFDDYIIFEILALWCFDNCNDKWYLDWNTERAYFIEETDAMAFKLRWVQK